jgi:hypothetical protein
MKPLEIEWRHLDKEGKTCDRCSDTGDSVRSAHQTLIRELQPQGWHVALKETLLTDEQIPESNNILLNGIPLEQLIPGVRKSENCCVSCGDLLGSPTMCRTIISDGRTFEAIPAAMILEAAYQRIRTENK